MATAIQPRPARSFKTSIDIPDDKRAQIVQLLNARLADTIDLRTQAKHAHWNVKGIQFFQLHELFDQIASHLEEHSDLVAERITALGGLANGTARHVASNSSLPEHDLEAITGEQNIRALAKGLAALAAKVRAGIDTADSIGDKGTSDLLTEVVRQADKDLWFLEAHLQA